GGLPWIVTELWLAQRLVSDELGLDHEPRRCADRLHLIADGSDCSLSERDQATRADPNCLAGGRRPLRAAREIARAKIKDPLMSQKLAVAHVKRLIVDEQPNQLSIGHVDNCLARLRVAVARLAIV